MCGPCLEARNKLPGRAEGEGKEGKEETGTILLENILNMANPKHAALLHAE